MKMAKRKNPNLQTMQHALETPILFLIFNRPDSTRVVFDQIRKARPRYLFVAADGARSSINGEKEKCEQTRSILQEVDWPCSIKTLFRDENLGCGPAVSSAITWFFEQVTEGIILEDDCYPDLSFFSYCTELLSRYRNTNEVMLIGGNNFQDGISRGKGSYYFSHYPEIWGWASWRRAWKNYDFEMNDLEATFESGNLQNCFKTRAEKKYWLEKFSQAKNGKTNTWDYQLMYSILKNKGLAISPQVNLVKNIGIENNPTHHSLADSKKDLKTNVLTFPMVHPVKIVADKTADQYTFSQIYSRSPRRLLRLVRENGLRNFLFYIFRNVLK